MPRHTLSALLAFLLTAAPAAAELSARAVWDELKRLAEEADADVDAAVATATGGVLTLSDIAVDIARRDGPGQIRVTLPELTLSERADGAVTIATPASFSLGLLATDSDTGEEIPANLRVTLTNAEIVAAERAGRTLYSFEGNSAALDLGDITVAGAPLDVELAAEAEGFTDSFVSEDGRRSTLAPGEADITLTGALALLNRLSDAGILTQGEAFSAVFALGLFARQGNTPDTFVSTIEVGPDGSVTANGQPLR